MRRIATLLVVTAFVLAPAADDCDLHPRHGAIVRPWPSERREAGL